MARPKPTKIALDEDVRPLLANLLRDRGWDAVSVVEAGRRGLADAEQLAWAARHGRVLITHNAADFAKLAASWDQIGRSHRGILISAQAPIGWLLRATLRVLSRAPYQRDWVSRIAWIEAPPRR